MVMTARARTYMIEVISAKGCFQEAESVCSMMIAFATRRDAGQVSFKGGRPRAAGQMKRAVVSTSRRDSFRFNRFVFGFSGGAGSL